MKAAFTLVEVLIAMAIGVLVIGAVVSVVLAVSRSAKKSEILNAGLTESRQVQEHLTRQLSSAVSDPIQLRFDFARSDGNTPARYARLTYRSSIGPQVKSRTTTLASESKMDVSMPVGMTPQPGDCVMLGRPNTDRNLVIQSVTLGEVKGEMVEATLTFTKTIQAATVAQAGPVVSGTWFEIHRASAYEVTEPGGGALDVTSSTPKELRFWENVANTAGVRVLSTNVAPETAYMFRPHPNDNRNADGILNAGVLAVAWEFGYAKHFGPANQVESAERKAGVSKALTGNREFWGENRMEGIIHARTGNPTQSGGMDLGPGKVKLTTTTLGTSTTSQSTTTLGTTTIAKSTTTKKQSTTTVKKSTTSVKKTTTVKPKSTTTVKKSTTTVKKLTSSTAKSSTTVKKTTTTIGSDS